MSKLFVGAAASLLWTLAATAEQADPLQAASSALGASELHSLQFSAVGNRSQFSQSLWTAYPYMPGRTISSYQDSINFDSVSSRVESAVTTSPTTGYFVGEQHSREMLSGGFAWSESTQPTGRPAESDRPAAQAQPQPDAVPERLFWLWMSTPQGVLKAARGSAPHSVEGGTEFSFSIADHYHVTALVNHLNQVSWVHALIADPVLGDTLLEVRYSGYRDFSGIQFPSLISEYEGGYPIIALAVTGVQLNPGLTLQVPDNVRAYKAAEPQVKSQKIADGVYWLTGANHHSMAVDMGNSITMVEAPTDEARSIAVIDETRRLIPGKPIRYVINTHVHFDHSGGLRTYVDAGAIVVTQTVNRAFYEKAWAAPRTLEPDRLSKSRKRAKFMTVEDHAVIKGSNGRSIEINLLEGNPHNEENLVAWLPTERILFESDMLNGNSYAAPVSSPTPVISNFYDNLHRLNIVPLQIVGGHGSHILSMSDLNHAAGKGDAG